MNKLKEKLTDFSYKFYRIIYFYKDIRFFFKQTFYRLRLFSKLWKQYVAPWEIVESVLDFNMNLFCDFYRNGGINCIEWGSDESHFTAKKWFDKIYKYWTVERLKLVKEYEKVLSNWSDCTPMRLVDSEFENFKEVEFDKSENSEKLFKLHTELKQKIDKMDTKYLKKIVELRGYMWT